MTDRIPEHCTFTHFPIVNGQLQIGKIPLQQLAHRVGQTPFFAYDRSLINNRVEYLRHQLPSEIQLHYAIKANPMPAVVQHLAHLVDGLDVASAGEMHIALDTIVPASNISFAGPGKGLTALKQAIAAGVVINVESQHELNCIAQQSEALGLSANIAIRINPNFELKSAGMKMSGSAKQFGIDEAQIPELMQRVKSYALQFQGFHIFSGSQNLNTDAIIEAQSNSLELAIKYADLCPSPIKSVNIGGGFGIPYFPGDKPIDLSKIGIALETQLASFKKYLPDASIVLELGRYLIGEAGIYVTQIVDKKTSYGQTFLITDGGLNHHLAATGNLGQVIRKNYPVVIGNKMDAQEYELVSVTGPLCTPLDILADKMFLPKAEIGDLVAIYQSGAYGYSASPINFLHHTPALEVLA